MTPTNHFPTIRRLAACALLVLGSVAGAASATEPCDDFGECKVLIEINATDGDIGFHFLVDGDDLIKARLEGPDGDKVFEDQAKGPMIEQKLTETFAESAEPLCWEDPEAEEGEEIVTLEEFLDRWTAGTYLFSGLGAEGEHSEGETELTYQLPAAPADVDFDVSTGMITWDAGDDLGNCASFAELTALVAAGVLPEHPEDVEVDSWEVVLEPDVEDGDPIGSHVFSIRVSGDPAEFDPTVGVEVPAAYLASLPDNTPVKVEVGAIGGEDNATFTEEDGFCVNEGEEGCEE